MRNTQIYFLARVAIGGFAKRANIINVPEGLPGLMPKRGPAAAPAGLTHYLTGEQQFGKGEPSFLGAAGRTATGLGRTALSPLLGLVSAGGAGANRTSGLAGIAGTATDVLGNTFSGNWAGARRGLSQLGQDINPVSGTGAWSKAIQRHVGKGSEDVSRQIPNWWNYPGGFWETWGRQSAGNTANYGSKTL